jgi:hypothetical protein
MPESHATIQPGLRQAVLKRPVCEHRFDVVCIDGQFMLDLWECRYCGQRVRRKKPTLGRPAGV